MTVDTHEDIKLTNSQIAWRAAQDIQDGAYVNLGIGFPEMVAKYQPPGRQAIFHTENGILDFGEAPEAGQEDWDLINAGKKAVTLKPESTFFHHADSFAMVRGGHLDVSHSRRLSGCPERRPRKLAGREQGSARRRRRDGPRPWREASLRHYGACDEERRVEACRKVHVPAYRRRLRHPHIHEPRGHRCC